MPTFVDTHVSFVMNSSLFVVDVCQMDTLMIFVIQSGAMLKEQSAPLRYIAREELIDDLHQHLVLADP